MAHGAKRMAHRARGVVHRAGGVAHGAEGKGAIARVWSKNRSKRVLDKIGLRIPATMGSLLNDPIAARSRSHKDNPDV